jgi:hypothetical protein
VLGVALGSVIKCSCRQNGNVCASESGDRMHTVPVGVLKYAACEQQVVLAGTEL